MRGPRRHDRVRGGREADQRGGGGRAAQGRPGAAPSCLTSARQSLHKRAPRHRSAGGEVRTRGQCRRLRCTRRDGNRDTPAGTDHVATAVPALAPGEPPSPTARRRLAHPARIPNQNIMPGYGTKASARGSAAPRQTAKKKGPRHRCRGPLSADAPTTNESTCTQRSRCGATNHSHARNRDWCRSSLEEMTGRLGRPLRMVKRGLERPPPQLDSHSPAPAFAFGGGFLCADPKQLLGWSDGLGVCYTSNDDAPLANPHHASLEEGLC
jgi:hypothetical protein